jgi:hypothetical protein
MLPLPLPGCRQTFFLTSFVRYGIMLKVFRRGRVDVLLPHKIHLNVHSFCRLKSVVVSAN